MEINTSGGGMRKIIGVVALLAMGCAAAGENAAGLAGKRVPDLLPVTQPAMVAQATTTSSKLNMTLGVCEGVKTPDDPQGQLGGQLAPAGWYLVYMQRMGNTAFSINGAKVTLLNGPTHGRIEGESLSRTGGPSFGYIPNHGFLGQDQITFLVEVGGKRIKVVTTLYVDNHGLYCENKDIDVERISNTNTPDLAVDLASWLSATHLFGQFANSGITLNLADLAGGAVGQTVGSTITLDTNAAGHNWFIDTTGGTPDEASSHLAKLQNSQQAIGYSHSTRP